MRVLATAMALSILSHTACADSSTDAVTRLKSCFQLDRVAQIECLEKLSRELHDNDVQTSVQPPEGTWVISETTSPVDYSPVITAAALSQSNAKDAPTRFAIRCRGQRTDVLVSTEGAWRASRVKEFHVDYRINDQPVVGMQWLASTDGRTALFKDDAVRFLQSLPDKGRITVSVSDWQGPAHEATFQLAGLDAVRQKIGMACKWAPAAARMSPAGR